MTNPTNNGQAPPNCLLSERATIGAMLVNNDIIPDVRGILSVDDFYHRDYAEMYRTICALHDQGDVADAVTVFGRLGWDDVSSVMLAMEGTPHSAHAPTYAAKVHEMSQRRRMINEAKANVAAAFDFNRPLPGARTSGGPVVRCFADIEPRETNWTWGGRWPAARITVLGGNPGLGKSFVTTDAAARISTGTPWPDGKPCPRGSVIFITAEDCPHDTIRPRLDAHHADVSKIHIIEGVRRLEGGEVKEVMFTLADVDALEETLKSIPDCKLVVIDPIGSFLGGKTDGHRDNEVRGVLAPIARLAEQYGPTMLVVAHYRKSAGATADDAILGSRGFTGIARAVWHLSRDPENKSRRLLLPGKNNLAPEGNGLAFTIIPDPPRIAWEKEPVEMSADDAMETKPGPAPNARKAAEGWLKERLKDGSPVPCETLKTEATEQKISYPTLHRAKDNIGVVCRKNGQNWEWLLPTSQPTSQPATHNDLRTWQVEKLNGEQVDEYGFPIQ